MMKGWNGRILRVDLTKGKHAVQDFGAELALKFLGGRGFATKILWDEVKGIDPLSPDNKLIFAAGPLTGLAGPSVGKLVVAAKSPLTGGYGDGNIGTMAAVNLRRAGYDALVVEGRADKPVYVYIEDGKVEVLSADWLWGLNSFETEDKLVEKHGRDVGVLAIGRAGEKLVKFATIVSQSGRSGGRPGMGAVMGSKNLKAIVIRGTRGVEVADRKKLEELARDANLALRNKPSYSFWMRQGTMATIQWSQANSVLPTRNFSEGVFELSKEVDGDAMERLKVKQRGCPICPMICGNVIETHEGLESELDYENVAMLGPNIGLGDLRKVAALVRFADEAGLDAISLGNVIGFAMEASERGLIGEKLEWGDFDGAMRLAKEIVEREGIGDMLAEGVASAARRIGRGAEKFAMHVKGLEISAYDCRAAPGMALAYGTSPIGAHHKDAWVIAWEISFGRESYAREKVEKVVELQRIRGGMFETLVSCRFPWVEVGLELDWYPKLLEAATGVKITLNDIFEVADRIYSLMRAYWVRELGGWSRELDTPPAKWFEAPLSEGPLKGAKLSREGYGSMLSMYYEIRGWDERGVPRASTLERLGLGYVATELSKVTKLAP